MVFALGWAAFSLLIPPISANEKLEAKIKALNELTGNKAILGKFSSMLEEKKATQELVDYAQKLVKKEPETLNFNAAFLLGGAAKALEDYDASETFYRICTKKAANLESTEKLRRSYFALIDILYDNNKYEKCSKVCQEVLELQGGEGKPRVVKVPFDTRFGQEIFVDKDNFDSARSLKPLARIYQIQSITKMGKFDEALKQIEELMQVSDHWQIRQIRAWILREAGRFKEAVEGYQDVLQSVSTDRDLEADERQKYEDRYRSILSNLYVDLGEIKKATDLLRTLAKRHPDEPGYLNDLGYIMADNDMNLEEAEKFIRKAIDLDRKRKKSGKVSGAYLDSLGWVLFKQKRYKEAKEWLLKAVEDKNAQHIEIYDHLGEAHLALGETEAALAAWKRGVEVAGASRREQVRKKRVLEKIRKHSE